MGLVGTILSYFGLAVSYIAPFLFVLGLVVIVHELGHFIVGRLCGVGVEAFSFGMGPEVLGYTDRRGTRWRFSAMPIGGYVKFAGDSNIASAPEGAASAAVYAESHKVGLQGQPVARRAAIVAAGPIASFILGILIFSFLAYFFGIAYRPPRIETVAADSPAYRAGFLKSDIVRSIDGKNIYNFSEIIEAVAARPNEAMTFIVERDGAEFTLQATPALVSVDTPIGPQRLGQLGMAASSDPNDFRTIYPTVPGAFREGLAQTWKLVSATGEYLARVVVGRASTDQLSGPIRIAQISSAISLLGFAALLNLAAILSISLGLMNFLPVPMLDGGHLVFYAIEAATGRQVNKRAQEYSLRVGLTLIAALTIFVTFNDIWRLLRA